MRNKIEKGEYGYIDSYKRSRTIVSILWLVAILIVYLIGLIIFKTNKNYVAVVAILMVLPAAKVWTALVVTHPFHTQPKEQYDTVLNLCKEYKVQIYSDLMLSKYEGLMNVAIAVVYHNHMVAMVPQQKKSLKQVEDYLYDILEESRSSNKPQVFDDFSKFTEALSQLFETEEPEENFSDQIKENLLGKCI